MGPIATTYDENTSDHDLCLMATRGDSERAFRVIYRRYWDRIYRLSAGYAKNPDDANDIAQQVFVRAHRSIHRFRGHAQFYTWLYRFAINCCKDWIKQAHQARCDRRDEVWWSERAAGDGLFGVPTRTESGIEQREAQDALQMALSTLRPEFKSALVLREIEGLSYREVGVALSCSEGTVKSRISRARRQLRRELIARGYSL